MADHKRDNCLEGRRETAVEDKARDTAVEDMAVEDTAVGDTTVEDTAVEDTVAEDTMAEGKLNEIFLHNFERKFDKTLLLLKTYA